MQSLLLLAVLFFVFAPIVLFFLVLGARSRVDKLERTVAMLQTELERVRSQQPAKPAHSAAAIPTPAPVPVPVTVPASTAAPVADAMQQPRPSDTITPPLAAATAATGDTQTLPAWGREISTSQMETHPVGVLPSSVPPPLRKPVPQKIEEPSDEPTPPPAWLIAAKEWLFGGNLVAKVGLLILFIGVSFLLKYAAARVTVLIEYRLAGITLADIGLLIWGWRIRASRPGISLPVQGAALGILMLVTFGAFRIYHLIPGGMAFVLLFVLTAFTCILAVLQNAVWLAVFGIVGGFAAPILTSTGQGSHIALFSYYALLNAGIVAIALQRSWRMLNLLGFVFTFLIATTWGVLRYQPEFYASVQGFLILFFLFYVAIAILYAIKEAPQLNRYVDGTLVFGTPLLGFGLQYAIVHDKPFGMAFSALALGLFYTTLTLLLWRGRGGKLRLLVEAFLALGILFGTLAIPFALDGRWTSAAWALEGAGIVWVGLRQRHTLAWMFGVLVQIGAWISFIGSISGLTQEVAAHANLWLGFLLLAGTGLMMAMTFRKQATVADGDDGDALPAAPFLATLFLGVAALWLLTGAWTEIGLRTHGHLQSNLLVLSAVLVAAILGVIATRLSWSVARYFALLPQLAAGAALAYALFEGRSLDSNGNLFDGPFLGAFLIAFSAGFSSLMAHRQAEILRKGIAAMLLVWSAIWWFALVLPSLAAWGEWMLAANTTLGASRADGYRMLYNLLLAAGALVFAVMATRLNWPALRWLAMAVWPGLLIATLGVLQSLHRMGLVLPGAAICCGFIALWLAGEWLLQRARREAWMTVDDHSLGLCLVHSLRTIGPWLIIWPLGHHLITLALQPASAREAMALAEAGWYTTGSWARYLPAWLMMGFIGVLIARVRAHNDADDDVAGWPVAPIAFWYQSVLIPLGTIWSVMLVAFWNLTHNGAMAPLPYVPILNPLDITTGFAALLGIAAWRMHNEHIAYKTEDTFPENLRRVAALLAYVWFNLMLLRSAAQYLDIAYRFDGLFRSQFVQAMLSLVWSATALVLMYFAARRQMRPAWMAGAALLALVVAKLFFVDLSNVGGIERIVSFLGVGALMLSIGYLAPWPGSERVDSNADTSVPSDKSN